MKNRRRTPRPHSLIRARERAVTRLPPWSTIVRGTLMRYYRTCGKQRCRCYRSKRHRHGPYWYLAVSWKGGRQKLYAIPPALVPEIRKGIAAYDTLWRQAYRIAEFNLALLKQGGEGRRQ